MILPRDPLLCVEHRPYPRLTSPWIMRQVWHDLLFAHWPLPPAALRPLIPQCLDVDTYDGQAWIGVVPFTMSGVTARFAPALPWLSKFPELNVRTYVHINGHAGVYFFSLDAANPVAVEIAKRFYHLPYYYARMSAIMDESGMHYSSYRIRPRDSVAQFKADYAPNGPASFALPGSLEYWLTERYCLYTTSSEGRPFCCEIHHGPWPLQPASATIEINTMALSAGIILPDAEPILYFSKCQNVQIWPLCCL